MLEKHILKEFTKIVTDENYFNKIFQCYETSNNHPLNYPNLLIYSMIKEHFKKIFDYDITYKIFEILLEINDIYEVYTEIDDTEINELFVNRSFNIKKIKILNFKQEYRYMYKK